MILESAVDGCWLMVIQRYADELLDTHRFT
jgi:hypothetical protein